MADIDLHCAKRKHGIIRDGERIEIHCRLCSAERGYPVYHQWRLTGGTLLPDREDRSAKRPKRAA